MGDLVAFFLIVKGIKRVNTRVISIPQSVSKTIFIELKEV